MASPALCFLQVAYEGAPASAPSTSDSVVRPRLAPARAWVNLKIAPPNTPVCGLWPLAAAAISCNEPFRASTTAPDGSFWPSVNGTSFVPTSTNTLPLTGLAFTLWPSTGGRGAGSAGVVNVWSGPKVVPVALVATRREW